MIYVTAGSAWRCHTPSHQGNPSVKKRRHAHRFGRFWVSLQGTPKEKKLLKKLGKKKYQILFLDGAHENFDLLEQYPVEEWGGGTGSPD